jgi:hypothetical protein
MRIVAIVFPLLFGPSLFLSAYMLVKIITFGIGFLFFGDPIISRGMAWLNRKVPNWQKLLEPRKYVTHLPPHIPSTSY